MHCYKIFVNKPELMFQKKSLGPFSVRYFPKNIGLRPIVTTVWSRDKTNKLATANWNLQSAKSVLQVALQKFGHKRGKLELFLQQN